MAKKYNSMAVHSDYEVRWQNFKGFKDTGWIKIKPITIIIGANNAGKTSFIAPLLLMNQTISSRDATSPLVIRGNLFDGGNIKEIVHGYKMDKDIFLGFRYHVHDKPKKIKPIGSYQPGAFEVTIGKLNENDKEVIVKQETIYDFYLREYLSIFKESKGNYNISGLKLEGKELDAVKAAIPINFLFTPGALLTSLENVSKGNKGKEETTPNDRLSKEFEDLIRAINRNFTDASRTIMNLSYIGPIREIPHRYYEIGDEKYKTVGQRGENTPYLLKNMSAQNQEELNKWVQKFGFGDELTLAALADDVYSICFKNNGNIIPTNISNTGFGASQILPLIVQALVSPKESLTIAEQPEIHLNPKLQGVLADLFAFMAKKDQRVIIETHSEHLLLRLRTLVAKKEIKPQDLAIYYIEKEDGCSIIKKIDIDENGATGANEWPKGFFGDTLRESLALAAQQSKNRKS